MASVIRSSGCRYWIAAYRDANGKQHRRTTRQTQKAQALLIAQQYERTVKTSVNPQKAFRVYSEIWRDHFKENLPASSVEEFTTQWLAARSGERLASATMRRYQEVVGKFLAFLGPQSKRGLEEVGRAQIAGFRDAQLARSATATANTALKIIRRIFRAARVDGYILQDPAEGVKRARPRYEHDGRERRPFTVEELRAVLAVADPEWQSMIKFGLYSAQRLGDIARVKWQDVDQVSGEITFFIGKKGGVPMVIPMAPPLREHIMSMSTPDDPRAYVHPQAAAIVTGQENRVGTLSNQFCRFLITAGLREPQPHRSRGIGRAGKRKGMELSFHSLRHMAVSELKERGIPDAVVMEYVGHESAAMSRHYTHVGKAALSQAAQALPEI